MVALADVQASNARIVTTLPSGLVGVFVGATNGIGETTLKQFAKHTLKPRAYFIGRSQEAGDRIAAECKELNTQGEYTFIKANTSLIRNVDDVCQGIMAKEKSINLLCLTTGTMMANTETSEGLHFALALVLHSRARFIVNLLPLIQQATALRRVVSVCVGGKEGPIDMDNIQGWNAKSLLAHRGHAGSLVTLSLEALAKKAPNVSFIHNYPGSVKSGIGRGATGSVFFVLKTVLAVIGPLVNMPNEECGERHLFLATSAKYPASVDADMTSGVPLTSPMTVARGTNGKIGSGVYSIEADGESAGPKVEELLAKFRTDGVVDKVWDHTEGEFKRITGVISV